MENNTTISANISNTTSNTEIEDDSLVLKVSVITCCTLYIIFDSTIILALKRTKTIPDLARFFAISLLLLYALIAAISISRRLTGYSNIAFSVLTVLAIALRMTSYTIIAMLALDRVIVIQCPFFYCRNFQSVKIKFIAVGTWVNVFSWFVIGMFWRCNLIATESELVKLICFKERTLPLTGPILGVTCVIVCVCLSIICKTVYKKSNGNERSFTSRRYKTTFAITGNIINFVIIVALYITAVVFLDLVKNVLFLSEVLTGLNALLDAAIYALWFKECRLELLKLFSVCIPKLEKEVERLRYQVFHISNN